MMTWNIEISPNNYIRLEFSHFQMESAMPGCEQDYVELYNILRNGSNGLLGRFCQPNPPPIFMLSGMNKMTVVFESDTKYSKSGFYAYYSSESYTVEEDIKQKITRHGKYRVVLFILVSKYTFESQDKKATC